MGRTLTLGLIVLSLVERLSLLRGKTIHENIGMVLQQVSFVERLSLSQRVPYQRFHCIVLCTHVAPSVYLALI